MDILLSTDTKAQIDHFISHPSHALGVFGPAGSGKFYTAHYIAASILGKDEIENNPNLHIVRPAQKASITIDQAREVVSFLKLKHSSGDAISRIVIIDNGGALTSEAQNALLKTLEEPPRDALIIMTATGSSTILPTITSRLKIINLKPVIKKHVLDFFSEHGSSTSVDKAYAISNGRPGLIAALLANENHDLISAIEDAKQFLGQSQYERLCAVDQIIKHDVNLFLEALQLVSDSAFKHSVHKDNHTQSKKWHTIRKQTAGTISSLRMNAHTKLAVTNLILSI